MQTAIWISLISLAIAMFSLGWNIFRDVILKPKLKVIFGVRTVTGQGITPKTYVSIEGTNFGPGQIICQMISGMNAPFFKRIIGKKEFFVIIHDYENPLSSQLPKKLEVGEKINLLLLYGESDDCILTKPFTHIGLSDSFGRIHYAKKSQIKEAKETFLKEFKRSS